MKKLILISLLALTACKKDVINSNNPISQNNQLTFDVIGQSVYPSGQILYIKNGSQMPDSVYNYKRTDIKVYIGDTLYLTDNNNMPHSIKLYLDNKLVLDTINTPQLYFKLKFIVK